MEKCRSAYPRRGYRKPWLCQETAPETVENIMEVARRTMENANLPGSDWVFYKFISIKLLATTNAVMNSGVAFDRIGGKNHKRKMMILTKFFHTEANDVDAKKNKRGDDDEDDDDRDFIDDDELTGEASERVLYRELDNAAADEACRTEYADAYFTPTTTVLLGLSQ